VVRNQLGMRVATVSLALTLSAASLFFAASYVANAVRPGYKDTWLLINSGTPLVAEEHVDLPLLNVVRLVEPIDAESGNLAAQPAAEPGQSGAEGGYSGPVEVGNGSEAIGGGPPAHISTYCSV